MFDRIRNVLCVIESGEWSILVLVEATMDDISLSLSLSISFHPCGCVGVEVFVLILALAGTAHGYGGRGSARFYYGGYSRRGGVDGSGAPEKGEV